MVLLLIPELTDSVSRVIGRDAETAADAETLLDRRSVFKFVGLSTVGLGGYLQTRSEGRARTAVTYGYGGVPLLPERETATGVARRLENGAAAATNDERVTSDDGSAAVMNDERATPADDSAAGMNDERVTPGRTATTTSEGRVTATPAEQSAYVRRLPGRVQAEDFDSGGEGVAYHDTDSTNEFGAYRPDSGVDIRQAEDSGGRYNVGSIRPGEWLEYSVRLPAGTYDISARVAAANDGARLRFLLDGTELGTLDLPVTGGRQNWETVTLSGIPIENGGHHTFRVESMGTNCSFDWFEVTASEEENETGSTPTGTQPSTPVPKQTLTPAPEDKYGKQGYGELEYGG